MFTKKVSSDIYVFLGLTEVKQRQLNSWTTFDIDEGDENYSWNLLIWLKIMYNKLNEFNCNQILKYTQLFKMSVFSVYRFFFILKEVSYAGFIYRNT